MNICKTRRGRWTGALGSMLLSAMFLHACGGSSLLVSGIGGTGIVFGTITGFGSVYVNGTRYETDDTQFVVDGNELASQADLSIGMVVELEVELVDGALTGKALNLFYDDEVQGPVAMAPVDVPGSGGSRKTFDIFGQTIEIDETGTFYEGTGFEDINADPGNVDVLEVSGFRTSPSTINATYVKRTGALQPGVSEVELRGFISDLQPSNQSFMLDGVPISYDDDTSIELDQGSLANGLFVEVEGIYIGPSVHAEEIEQEDEGFDEDLGEISLQGVIVQFSSVSSFLVNGQQVDASNAEFSPSGAAALLGVGVNVEVEGKIIDGVLVAEELELREGETKLKSTIASINLSAGSFTVGFAGLPGTINVVTDGQTAFEDEAGSDPEDNISLADLNQFDYVKVEGNATGNTLRANVVKRKDPDDIELEGPVSDFDSSAYSWITLLGITYNVDPGPGPLATQFPGFANAAAFFAALSNGDIVEIKDEQPDGVADEIELD